MGRPPFAPTEIIARLVAAGVDFVLIGGLAATLQGAEAPTLDIDISYDKLAELIELRKAIQGEQG